MIELAFFQPDIPQNVGAMMRLCACLGLRLHIIEPCGFPWNLKKIQQSGMDYVDNADVTRHADWVAFQAYAEGRRIILMTTKSAQSYLDFAFEDDDILLAGSESSGAPDYVHHAVNGRVVIPMYGTMRSLNIVNATAMITGEALRQVR
jgi:tRNA (cytidine/uridine-2'-O-)-methyltransferase